jgi:hypothetical protein
MISMPWHINIVIVLLIDWKMPTSRLMVEALKSIGHDTTGGKNEGIY